MTMHNDTPNDNAEETRADAFDAATPEDSTATDEIPSDPKPGYGWSDTAPRGGRAVLKPNREERASWQGSP